MGEHLRQAPFDLRHRTALVTGATGYLGMAICRALGEAGAHVLVNARKTADAVQFVETLEGDGLSARAAVFDVRDEVALAEFTAEMNGTPLHVLVNAAYKGGGGTIESSTREQFQHAFDVGLVAVHSLLRSLLPNLREGVATAGDASVINLSSMYGVVSPDLRVYDTPNGSNPPFYGATKAALIQYTRYAAAEFGRDGIRVNAIAPGPFPAKSVQDSAPDFITRLEGRVPLGRIGQASEIGGPVVFLASSAASYVTGSVLTVDGGWTAW